MSIFSSLIEKNNWIRVQCSAQPPPEIILLWYREALNIRLSHWHDFTQEFPDKCVTLSRIWRLAGGWTGRAAAATCRVTVLIRIKTFWILIQTTILTRAGLFLISWLSWPRPARVSRLSRLRGSSLLVPGHEEKLSCGLVLSCLIFITGPGFMRGQFS